METPEEETKRLQGEIGDAWYRASLAAFIKEKKEMEDEGWDTTAFNFRHWLYFKFREKNIKK